jgi:hypothetical protein
VLPPSGAPFQAPKLVQPANSTHFKLDPKGRVGSYENSVTFEWLPAGTLENGKIRCSWNDQPSGTQAAIFDRYIVKIDPPLPRGPTYSNRNQPIDTFTDGGTKIIIQLERFQISRLYTWKVAVGRWCVVTTPGVNREQLIDLVSPYSESRTFSYSR